MVGSWTDWALSEQEVREANKIGEKLKKELVGQRLVLYASDLLRAKQTAGKHRKTFELISNIKDRIAGEKSRQVLRQIDPMAS